MITIRDFGNEISQQIQTLTCHIWYLKYRNQGVCMHARGQFLNFLKLGFLIYDDRGLLNWVVLGNSLQVFDGILEYIRWCYINFSQYDYERDFEEES